MPNTNSTDALAAAANAALVAKGARATVKVALPDGTVGGAEAGDIWLGLPGQTIRVWQNGAYFFFWACQLSLVA